MSDFEGEVVDIVEVGSREHLKILLADSGEVRVALVTKGKTKKSDKIETVRALPVPSEGETPRERERLDRAGEFARGFAMGLKRGNKKVRGMAFGKSRRG